MDVARIKSLFFRQKSVDQNDILKRLVNEYRLGQSERWKEVRDYLYQRFTDNWELAFAHFLNGDNANSWNVVVRCFEDWDLISRPERAIQELRGQGFSQEKINQALDEVDLPRPNPPGRVGG